MIQHDDDLRTAYEAIASSPVKSDELRAGVRRRVRRRRAAKGVAGVTALSAVTFAVVSLTSNSPGDRAVITPAAPAQFVFCEEVAQRAEMEFDAVQRQAPWGLVLPSPAPEGSCLAFASIVRSADDATHEYTSVSLGFRWDGAAIQLFQTDERYAPGLDPYFGTEERLAGRAWKTRAVSGPYSKRTGRYWVTRLTDGRTVAVDIGQDSQSTQGRRFVESLRDNGGQ